MLMGSFRISVAIYVVAELGIADMLATGPQLSTALASMANADAGALYRVLRMLATAGLFEEVSPRRFGLTTLGAGLRHDVIGSLRPLALNRLDEPRWQAWGHLLHSVRTLEPGFNRAHGMSLFEYMRVHPQHATRFNDAMTSESARSAAAIVAAYDFSSVERLVDVGGGHGVLLGSILAANPTMRGALFDVPEVIRGAGEVLKQLGVADRCDVVAGDFFDALPAGDAYIMLHVLHNWDDSHATAILTNCRRGLQVARKVLVVERAIAADYRDDLATLMLDLQMLVMLGGQERTEADYRALFTAAGFDLRHIVPVGNPPECSVFEGVPC
jgi:hypothetical protein